MSYNSQMGKLKGKYRFIKVQHTSKGAGCEACGHIIYNVFIIEEIETKKKIHVGSECIKNLIGDKETLRTLKAIKSIETKVKNDYERPIKQEQIKKYVYENRELFQLTTYEDTVLWRIEHDTNPQETLKILKERLEYREIDVDVNFKFVITKEQKEEIKKLQIEAVNQFLESLKR